MLSPDAYLDAVPYVVMVVLFALWIYGAIGFLLFRLRVILRAYARKHRG